MSIADELALFVAPLPQALTSVDEAGALLRALGLMPEGPGSIAELPEVIADLAETADTTLTTLMEMASEEEFDAADAIEAVLTIASVLDAVQELIETASGPVDDFALPFDVGDTWTTLATALPGYLLASWLRVHHPVADGTLRLLGAVTDNGPGRARVDFDAIGGLLTDPPAHMRTVVGDDPAVLLPPIQTIAAALGKTRPARPITFDEQRAYVDDGAEQPQPPRLDLTIASPELGENWSIDVGFEPVTLNGGTRGLQVLATGNGELEATTLLSPEWSLTAALAVEGAAGFVIVPDGVQGSEANAAADASLTLAGLPETPWVLFGNPGATRLELAGLTFIVAGEQLESNPEVSTTIRSDGLRLVVAPGDGDSFISGVLGSLDLSADASFALTWSSVDGFSLTASEGGIELTIPIERALGPIIFKALHIGVGADPAGVTTDLGASLGFVLGPISAYVENIGISLLRLARRRAGPRRVRRRRLRGRVQAADRARAHGRGDRRHRRRLPRARRRHRPLCRRRRAEFHQHRPDRGRHRDDADARRQRGLVDVPQPVGVRFVGIQLGFGFTLNGVGGLVGINRGLDEDALGDAVRTGSLDADPVPRRPDGRRAEDPRRHRPRLPAGADQYVFGPVVKIGWGTPTLIELDVGVVMQLPNPLTLSLLGALSAVLPTEEARCSSCTSTSPAPSTSPRARSRSTRRCRGSQVAGLRDHGRHGGAGRRSSATRRSSSRSAASTPSSTRPTTSPRSSGWRSRSTPATMLRITLGGYFALTSNTRPVRRFAYSGSARRASPPRAAPTSTR